MDVHAEIRNEPRGEGERISELSLADALGLAMQIHRRGHLVEAEVLYRRVLAVAPDSADASHFLGVLLHQAGHGDAALAMIRRSIELNPGEPNYYNNLGNVLVETGRLDEAAAAYEQVIALAPGHANAHTNLGTLHKTLGRLEEAAASYRKAIEADPGHVDAHNNMGKLLAAQGRGEEAVAWHCKAITLMHHHPDSRRLLGIAHYTLGQIDKAAEVYRQWLADEPENPVARHMLAACSGRDVPPRAPDDYVESTFDRFADSFDAKLEKLAYRAPQLVAEALGTHAAPEKRLVTLDAGCGTGLCGPLLAPYASRLVGVDLSSGMLARARSRHVYDELIRSELTAYLLACPATFDLVVSADTLVYFGALEDVLHAAHRALRDGGLLIFTVEAGTGAAGETGDEDRDADYRIHPHGRYSHGAAYLRGALSAAGFTVAGLEPAVLRMVGGSPVHGRVVTGRRDG